MALLSTLLSTQFLCISSETNEQRDAKQQLNSSLSFDRLDERILWPQQDWKPFGARLNCSVRFCA